MIFIRDMEAKKIIEFMRSILDHEDVSKLNFANKVTQPENRRTLLRGFFHRESVFNKIKPTVDPTWLCTEIITKGSLYEF